LPKPEFNSRASTEILEHPVQADFLNALDRTLWGNIEINAANPLFGQVTGVNDWCAPSKIHLDVRADW
jgi:hypothetical protein